MAGEYLTVGSLIWEINVLQGIPGYGIPPESATLRGLDLEQSVTINNLSEIIKSETGKTTIFTRILMVIVDILNKDEHVADPNQPIDLDQGRPLVQRATNTLKRAV